jgi:hypothetical protein
MFDRRLGHNFERASCSDPVRFQVNTTIEGDQYGASAAVNAYGSILVAWAGNGICDDVGVFAQRYAQPPPAARVP